VFPTIRWGLGTLGRLFTEPKGGPARPGVWVGTSDNFRVLWGLDGEVHAPRALNTILYGWWRSIVSKSRWRPLWLAAPAEPQNWPFHVVLRMHRAVPFIRADERSPRIAFWCDLRTPQSPS